jgi:FkbM family methyltransferase
MSSILYKSNGFDFSLYPEDSISKHIQKGEEWEPHMLKFMSMFLKPDNTAIDMGACFGYHTLHMAKLCGKGTVYAFEPFDVAMKLLLENIKNNDLKNIICVDEAVGNYCGKAYICNAYNDSNINIGDSFVNKQYSDNCIVYKGKEKLKLNGSVIECTTLDKFRKFLPKAIDFIKIDIQGYELYALQSGVNTLMKDKPVIAIEVEEECLLMNGYDSKVLFDYIFSIGYDIFYLESDYPCDHVCVHKDKLEEFMTIFSPYVKDHTENNDVSNNFKAGVVKKLSLPYNK